MASGWALGARVGGAERAEPECAIRGAVAGSTNAFRVTDCMVGQDLRRKPAAHARSTRDGRRGPRGANGPAGGGAGREALDVASYISDMTAQLEAMSLAAGLDLLGYFLAMARSEADMFVRTNATGENGAEGADDERDGFSDEGQAAFEGPAD